MEVRVSIGFGLWLLLENILCVRVRVNTSVNLWFMIKVRAGIGIFFVLGLMLWLVVLGLSRASGLVNSGFVERICISE